MSAAGWAVVIMGVAFIVATEAVILALKRRLRRGEAAFARDFGTQADRELPGLLEDENG